ncbi:MAG TPA: phosphoribosylformylglycinamidine synthase subunit PurQ [Desulfonatronum sp.]|nr:phosphoribosylformylglycinamidine synthase subunit PurQ [Desulfonatronum sp.]
MDHVKALVLTGYGTNCHRETAHTALLAGADQADVVHFSQLISGDKRLVDYNFLIFPGGFLDGDDLGAAQAAALRWRYAKTDLGNSLLEELRFFFDSGGLILGICNGFQLLVKLGLLPALGMRYFERQVSLSHNDSARFEDRWVHLRVNSQSPCIFTRGLNNLYFPVRHGEGKLVARSEDTLAGLEREGLVALTYVHPETGRPSMEYPYNPNGSPKGIAGLSDPSGRILGLMPHPEAYNHLTNHPAWTRGRQETLGISLLANGVAYLRSQEK